MSSGSRVSRAGVVAAVAVSLLVGQASAVEMQRDWQQNLPTVSRYVVVDSSGNVYARVAEGTYKFDTNGNQLSFSPDAAETAALGDDLVARTWAAADGGLVVEAANDAGTVLWQASLSRPGATQALVAIAASAAREVFVALNGTDAVTGAVTPWLAKIGADGAVRWSLDTLPARAIHVDPWPGDVYLTGPAGTARYGTLGAVVWQDANPGTLIRFTQVGLTVVNRKPSLGGYALDVSLYSSDGTMFSFASGAYDARAQYGQFSSAAAIDRYGNTYIAGQVWPTIWADCLIVRFDHLGRLAFASPYNHGGSEGFNALALDGNDNPYVAGYTWNGFDYAHAAARFGFFGNLVWVDVNNSPNSSATSIAVDRTFNVYSQGTYYSSTLLVKNSQWEPVSVTAGPGGSISPVGPRLPHGPQTTFTITPDPGYHVVDVLLDGSSQGPTTSVTLLSLDHPLTVSATFARNTYAVTAGAGAGGSVSPAGTSTVSHGDALTVAITPAAGFVVDQVLVDGVSVGAPPSYTFANVTAGHTLQATFKPMLTVTAPNGGETWRKGSTYSIRWARSGNPGAAVRIELLNGTAVSRVIAASAPVGGGATGSWSWRVPGSQATGANYRIRVTSTTNAAASDASNAAFTIR